VARRGGWEEDEINVFVLRPPSYAPGREKGRLAARRSHGEADGRDDVAWLRRGISAQRYCFCVQRTSVSLPSSSITTHPHPASRFFMARIRASGSRSPLVSLRFRSGREPNSPSFIFCNKNNQLQDRLGFLNDKTEPRVAASYLILRSETRVNGIPASGINAAGSDERMIISFWPIGLSQSAML